jgi:hypothetical protein
MEIADPIIIASMGALSTAIVMLFKRSERCLDDRQEQALRIDALERAIYGCPVLECPNKPKWIKPDSAPITRPQTSS